MSSLDSMTNEEALEFMKELEEKLRSLAFSRFDYGENFFDVYDSFRDAVAEFEY